MNTSDMLIFRAPYRYNDPMVFNPAVPNRSSKAVHRIGCNTDDPAYIYKYSSLGKRMGQMMLSHPVVSAQMPPKSSYSRQKMPRT